jgi:hypothetical protein
MAEGRQTRNLERQKGMSNAIRKQDIIADLCDQAGCSKVHRAIHYRQFMKGWHPHPSPAFVGWWQPDSRDPVSGADVGGHREARRRWARKDPGKYVHQWYGLTAESAYNTSKYREEFDAWVAAGSPEREPFVSIAAPLSRQKRFWRELKPVIAQISKPMPKVDPGAVALEGSGEIAFDEP